MKDPILLVLLGLLTAAGSEGCRKKPASPYDSPLPPAQAQAEAAREASAGAEEPPGAAAPSSDSGVRVVATLNGEALPDDVSCTVTAYDEGSTRNTRGRGRCGALVAVSPGSVDLVISLQAGALVSEQRLERQTVGPEVPMLRTDFDWAIGRITLDVAEGAEPGACGITLRQGQTVAAQAKSGETVTLAEGAYETSIRCERSGGAAQVSGPSVRVIRGQAVSAQLKLSFTDAAVAAEEAGHAAPRAPVETGAAPPTPPDSALARPATEIGNFAPSTTQPSDREPAPTSPPSDREPRSSTTPSDPNP